MWGETILLVIWLVQGIFGQIDLAQVFSACHTTSPDFDNCIKDSVNSLRPYFKQGLPDYGINSFDPFFASEVLQKRSGPFFNYKLLLHNVTESGWTASHVTRVKTDFPKHQMQLTQFFPDKRLNGWYEIDGTFLGQKVHNQGTWDLSLFDYTQTLTITRKPLKTGRGNPIANPPLKVQANIHTCKKLELHIGHLAGGRTIVENMLDRIINTAWQPGFVLLSPLINDLVSTAFTKIFNDDFQNFPFEQMFQP